MSDPTKSGPSPDQPASSIRVFTTPASAHARMQQAVASVLQNTKLSEEQRQQILIAMQCPCCGSAGVSLSVKLD